MSLSRAMIRILTDDHYLDTAERREVRPGIDIAGYTHREQKGQKNRRLNERGDSAGRLGGLTCWVNLQRLGRFIDCFHPLFPKETLKLNKVRLANFFLEHFKPGIRRRRIS